MAHLQCSTKSFRGLVRSMLVAWRGCLLLEGPEREWKHESGWREKERKCLYLALKEWRRTQRRSGPLSRGSIAPASYNNSRRGPCRLLIEFDRRESGREKSKRKKGRLWSEAKEEKRELPNQAGFKGGRKQKHTFDIISAFVCGVLIKYSERATMQTLPAFTSIMSCLCHLQILT